MYSVIAFNMMLLSSDTGNGGDRDGPFVRITAAELMNMKLAI